MREVLRIKEKRYNDSDALALYTRYREKNIGPFVREVGDFIAHERRNKGVTLETTVLMFSQLAFFQKYQSDTRIPINPYGPCGWWLKAYLLGKLKDQKASDIRRETGLTAKQAKAEINSWFPCNQPYPTKIECRNLSRFFGLVNLFSRYIKGISVFPANKAKDELREIFRREGIPLSEIPHFLVATAVLLAGRSCEIIPGFRANITVAIERPRSVELHDIPVPEGAAWKYCRLLPDGNLKVFISTQNETGDGLVGASVELLDTEVDTENYIDRRLIEVDRHGLVRLDLSRPLAFERNAKPMVYPI